MNKYYTLTTLLSFVSIRRYVEFLFQGSGKVSDVTMSQQPMRRKKLVAVIPESKVIKVLCRIGSETLRFAEGEELLLFDFLTNVSHYDSRQAPTCLDGKPQSPLVVRTSMFVYFIGNFDAQNLEFETHLLFRHRWRVSRVIHSGASFIGICILNYKRRCPCVCL